MDGLSLLAVTHELQQVVGARIERVQQPDRDTLVLVLNGKDRAQRLCVCASPHGSRIHLTELKASNPMTAPNFCMLLRKRIYGGRIVGVRQLAMDRCVTIEISAYDELGDRRSYYLIAELMGKHANISLCTADMRIIDCIRRIDFTMSDIRPMLPELLYEYPDQGVKQDPRTASAADFISAFDGADSIGSLAAARGMASAFSGISQATARRLLDYCGYDEVSRAETAARLCSFFSDYSQGAYEPCVLCDADGVMRDVSPFIPPGVNHVRTATICAALDAVYSESDERERVRRGSAALRKTIASNIERCERKIAAIQRDLPTESELERLKLYGELLTANIYRLGAGFESLTVENYYTDPPERVAIPVDRNLSVADNAQRYFKLYRKGMKSLEIGSIQIRIAQAELEYLHSLEYQLAVAKADEIDALAIELAEQGYLRKLKQRGKKSAVRPETHRFVTSEGIEVRAGRNGKQNDELTFKLARPNYTWLHAKDIPGSHVVIMSEQFSDATLEAAAAICAYYSKGRGSTKVPVDYTLRRYVKKPVGAKPGMVTYTNQRTIYAAPDERIIEALAQRRY
ncbi:MAG: NFACT RNA binding domain-containing protein [Clostridia bacterium]|nr:NFACT RNA binding domain-containing protein [Clostridia bacterium]